MRLLVSRFWGAHPVLHTGHGAVGVAQRVRQPVDAVAGLPIPVEAHSNSSTVEEEKQQRARGKAKRQVGTQGWWLQSTGELHQHFPQKRKALPPEESWGRAAALFAPVNMHSQQLSNSTPRAKSRTQQAYFIYGKIMKIC